MDMSKEAVLIKWETLAAFLLNYIYPRKVDKDQETAWPVSVPPSCISKLPMPPKRNSFVICNIQPNQFDEFKKSDQVSFN